MAPSTTEIDEHIGTLRSEIRNNRIVFWLCASGLTVLILVELALILIAVIAYNLRGDEAASGWTIAATILGFVSIIPGGGLIAKAVDTRDKIIRGRISLKREEEERKSTLAGGGSGRLAVLNRYKNDLPEYVEGLRVKAKRYRNVHSTFQFVIVVGSLGVSAVIGLVGDDSIARAVAVAASAAVAIAGAYSGYFRFKEKSLSLQSAADGIEQEHRAVQLSIGDYSGLSSADALTKFAEKVESNRTNQQRQAFELDQSIQVEYHAGPNYDLQ